MAPVSLYGDNTDIQEVVGLWPQEWCMPTELDARTSTSTESFATQKWKDAAQKAVCTLAEQKKKEATTAAVENPRTEDEGTTKVQVEREQKDSEESEKFSSQHTDEQDLSEQGGRDSEEKTTPFILKRHVQEKKGGQ